MFCSGRLSNDNSGFSGTWEGKPTILEHGYYQILVERQGQRTRAFVNTKSGNRNEQFAWRFARSGRRLQEVDNGEGDLSLLTSSTTERVGIFDRRLKGGDFPSNDDDDDDDDDNDNGGGDSSDFRFFMLNSDIALVANLEGHLDSRTGKVSCVLGESRNLPPCPLASTFRRTELYSLNEGQWMNDFRNVYMKMLMIGQNPPSQCSNPPCLLG